MGKGDKWKKSKQSWGIRGRDRNGKKMGCEKLYKCSREDEGHT